MKKIVIFLAGACLFFAACESDESGERNKPSANLPQGADPYSEEYGKYIGSAELKSDIKGYTELYALIDNMRINYLLLLSQDNKAERDGTCARYGEQIETAYIRRDYYLEVCQRIDDTQITDTDTPMRLKSLSLFNKAYAWFDALGKKGQETREKIVAAGV